MTAEQVKAIAIKRFGYLFTPTEAGLLLFKNGRIAVDTFGPNKGMVRDTESGEEWWLSDDGIADMPPTPAEGMKAGPVVEAQPDPAPSPKPTPLADQHDGAADNGRARKKMRPGNVKTAANGADPRPETKTTPVAEPVEIEVDHDAIPVPPVEESGKLAEERPRDADAAVVELAGFKLVRRQVKGFGPGVYRGVEIKTKGEDGETVSEIKWIWFSSPIEVMALARTSVSEGWSLLLQLVDPDGVEKRVVLSRGDIGTDTPAWRERLFNLGLELAPGREARAALEAYLVTRAVKARSLIVTTTGWKEE